MGKTMAFYADFAGHYDLVFPFREPTWQFLDRWLPEEGRILDLGCGTGHYCGRLAASDRDSLGIDLDPGMISRAQELYPQAKFQILGMEELHHLGAASRDGIICIGNVLPHLPFSKHSEFLNQIDRILRPGGRWIIQTVNFDPLLHLDEHHFKDLEFATSGLLFQRQYIMRDDGAITFATRLFEGDGLIFAGEAVLYPRLSHQYRDLHRAMEFKELAHFADFQEGPFLPATSGANVFVFEKPKAR